MHQHFTIFYQKMKGFSLNYLVRPAIIEQENGKSPAIFMLHGYGQNKEEFFSIANELPQEYIVISLQAPYKLSDIEFFWYAIEFGASMVRYSASTSRTAEAPNFFRTGL